MILKWHVGIRERNVILRNWDVVSMTHCSWYVTVKPSAKKYKGPMEDAPTEANKSKNNWGIKTKSKDQEKGKRLERKWHRGTCTTNGQRLTDFTKSRGTASYEESDNPSGGSAGKTRQTSQKKKYELNPKRKITHPMYWCCICYITAFTRV